MPVLTVPQSRCRLGIARADITPPVGIYHRMWGAAVHDRATGVHRPLTATAIALRPLEGDDEQVIVALDHCLLWAPEMEALRTAVAEKTGLDPSRLLVVFSHTHAAGLMGAERVGLPGGDLIPPYLERLQATVAELVAQARASTQIAYLSYATGRCSLAGHRDFWDEASQQFVCGFHPGGRGDDTVLVARATDDATGQTLVTLVNYACHPTTLAWQNSLISTDFPGAMREVIETATGAPCVFLQGASGDLGPREGFVGDPAVADRNGRQLGYTALAALETLPPPGTHYAYAGPVVSGATLGAWEHRRLSTSAEAALARWEWTQSAVELPYRPDLPTRSSNEADRARWLAEEEAARQVGDTARVRDCRALVERCTRWRTRLAVLPPGAVFPLPLTVGRLGDAAWLAVEGEHYQYLQTELRRRFPGLPLLVLTLANGSRCSYLPTRDAYGRGIYQESIAVLAAGSLERLADVAAERLAGLFPESARGCR